LLLLSLHAALPTCPTLLVVTIPASSRTPRCCSTVGSDTPAASSETVAGPVTRRSIIARRLDSASARNTRSVRSASEWLGIYLTIEVHCRGVNPSLQADPRRAASDLFCSCLPCSRSPCVWSTLLPLDLASRMRAPLVAVASLVVVVSPVAAVVSGRGSRGRGWAAAGSFACRACADSPPCRLRAAGSRRVGAAGGGGGGRARRVGAADRAGAGGGRVGSARGGGGSCGGAGALEQALASLVGGAGAGDELVGGWVVVRVAGQRSGPGWFGWGLAGLAWGLVWWVGGLVWWVGGQVEVVAVQLVVVEGADQDGAGDVGLAVVG